MINVRPKCPNCGNTRRNQQKAIWPKDELPQIQCTKCGHTTPIGFLPTWYEKDSIKKTRVITAIGDWSFDLSGDSS